MRSRRSRSSTCSCAGSPPWSGSGSSTTWRSSSVRSPTISTSSPPPSGSAGSSPRSSPRSSTSSATPGARRSCRSTATWTSRTSSPRKRSSLRSPAAATPSGRGRTSTGRDAKGQHVANLLAFQPGEEIAQVLDIPDYSAAPFLVLATREGRIKKTRLEEYDSNRAGGVIAINLADGDELVSARLLADGADILLVSRKGMSLRFTADDAALRPMGRATSGVTGMRFRDGDELLSMDVVRDVADAFVFVVTEQGYAKPDTGDRIIAIARNTERTVAGDDEGRPPAPDGAAMDAAAGPGSNPSA